jgi:hypothetical protein
LTQPIKNVISVRLASVEIPNTFYNFSAARSNIKLRICYPSGQTAIYNDIVITEGNYFIDTTDNPLPNNLMVELQTRLNENSLGLTFTATFNLITARLTLSADKVFDLDFITGNAFIYRTSEWGLGHNLGFDRNASYTGSNSYVGTRIVDTLDGNYLFLQLDPDWKVVRHWNSEVSETCAFAKIVINEPKNTIIYDDGSNSITKEYWFDTPVTVRSFPVKLLDAYGQLIDLLGGDISFTLELKEIMNPSLYQHYTQQQSALGT